MISGLTWASVRRRLWERQRRGDPDLRRVAAALAAQTVALLMIMLIVLEIVVYLTVQQRLISSLEGTLKTRATLPQGSVCRISRLPCGPNGDKPVGGFPGGPGGTEPGGGPGPGPGGNPDLTPSDASTVFVSPKLRVVHQDGVLGSVILDRDDVRTALTQGETECCDIRPYKGQTYLVYTGPLRSGGRLVGAVQTSISEAQFIGTMDSLRSALLVVALLGLLASSAISLVLVQRSLRPVRVAMQRQRDFVADAAHELRTPLAIQRAVAEVSMGNPSLEEYGTTIEKMLGENQHLTRLVEDLSLLARTDTEAISIERRPVDLTALVADTTQELRYLAEEVGVRLEVDVGQEITVAGDLLRLRQLLLILLDNALKHTPAGGAITVRLAQPSTGRVRLQVADSGPGIAPRDLPRIFDRFYRADKARTGGGSGLGLAIARWIAEAHGGAITAGNGQSRGAVFTVTLPAARTRIPA